MHQTICSCRKWNCDVNTAFVKLSMICNGDSNPNQFFSSFHKTAKLIRSQIGSAEVQLFADLQFQGGKMELNEDCKDLTKVFPDGASSILLLETTGVWHVFTRVSFRGPSKMLDPGRCYSSPVEMGLLKSIKSIQRVKADFKHSDPKTVSNSVTLYLFEDEQCKGKTVTLTEECPDLEREGLMSGASSIIVPETSGKWDVFTKPGFHLPMHSLLAGRVYQCPADMGLLSPIMSLRPTPK